MLQNTFLHIPGIGEKSERRLWQAGIMTWRDCLRTDGCTVVPIARRSWLLDGVARSIDAFEAGDWHHFERTLPNVHKWRAFGDLRDMAAYVDVETAPENGGDVVTMIGIFNGQDVKYYVRGENLEEAEQELNRYPLIVTYNGVGFDLPVIRRIFPAVAVNAVHIDLRFPLARMGLTGGLKNIERALGIARSAATDGLTGWDAVRLWLEYRSGRYEALDLLRRYNGEDVQNLKPIMELVFSRLSRACRSI